MRRSVFLLVCLCALVAGQARGEGYPPPPFDPQFGYTLFSIPRASRPPKIDGTIEPGEWDRAFMINAMADQRQRWTSLFARWVKWYVMWDADTLYVCCQSQRLPNETLICNYRDETLGGNTVMDDSIEVHFTPGGRNLVGKNLPWSAQAILNTLGVGFYSKFTWQVAARTTAWRPDWRIGSRIHKDDWVIEIAIPRASMDLAQPNKPGDSWSMLLARNWKRLGWNQSALPCHLTSFQVPQEHPFAYLTDGAFVRLEDVAGLLNGRLRTRLKLGTSGQKPDTVAIRMEVVEAPQKSDSGAKLFAWRKDATVAVTPGKLTDWSIDENPPLKPVRYRYHLLVTAKSSKNPLINLNVFFTPGSDAWLAPAAQKLIPQPYNFRAQLAPTRNVLSVFADFLNSPDSDAVDRLNIQVVPAGKTQPILNARVRNIHYASITGDFNLPPLDPGKYVWSMQLLDKKGKNVARQDGAFEKKDEAKTFPWWDFKGGRVDRVLWPCEPIRIENGGARSGYWGGALYLNGLCLPRQVSVTANRQWRPKLLEGRPSVLARSVEIAAVQGGKPAPVTMQGFPRTTDLKDWQAGLRGYGKIGETVEVQSDATFAQDGLLWVTLTLRPARDAAGGRDVRRKQATIDSLTIDIPCRADNARSMVAHGQPGYGSFTIGPVPSGQGVVWNCTEIGRSVLVDGNLIPLVWLGSDQRGLCFYAENNIGWVHAGKPDQQILRNPGEVVLRLNVIQKPLTIKGDWSFSFGLMPTPMCKMVPGWRMLDCNFSQNFADGFSTGRMAARGAWYNASYMPASYSKSRLVMFRNTENMITNLGGFEFAPHTERGGYESRSNDWPARNYFGPEWSQNTWTRAFQDHLLWNLQRWMDEGGLTGIYHDQFFPDAVTNSITGAAYKLPDGRTNRGYNMRLDRIYNMREHALFLENGIKPRIFCHTTNGGQMISYPWVTAVLDGEANMVIANADYDFVDIYPPERMQAYGNPWNWGNTFYWMRLIQPGKKDWQARQDRAYVGWTYLHDVFSNNTGQTRGQRAAFFDWGMNDNRVKFWPYWRIAKVVFCDQPAVLVSMWTLPDRALLCAFNTDKKNGLTAKVRVPLVDLGLMPHVRAEFIRGSDLEGGRLAFDAWQGDFTVYVPPHDYRLLLVRKYAN